MAGPFNPNGYDVTLDVKDNSPFSLLPSPLIKREVLQRVFKSISSNSLSYELTCQILSLAQEKSQIGKKEKKKHLDKNAVCIKIGDYLIFKNNDQNNFCDDISIEKSRDVNSLDDISEKEAKNNAEAERAMQSSESDTLSEKERRREGNKEIDLRSIKLNNIEVVFQKVCIS